ncbi:hypothetical protein Dimus_020057 [Dionaea muscipula]
MMVQWAWASALGARRETETDRTKKNERVWSLDWIPASSEPDLSSRVHYISRPKAGTCRHRQTRRGKREMGEATEDDLLLKNFLAEVSEVERDNEVARILSCFKLNPFEYLNLPFSASPEDVKKQYRKISLLVHPDKCKHPQAKEAFGALAKAHQLLLDTQEKDYILSQVAAAKEELLSKWRRQIKKDNASKIKSLVDEKFEEQHEKSDEFQQQLKLKVREILTEQEWRRRKMAMRISEEEGRLKKDEEEQKEMWKKKREHEEQWEGTREQRVSSWRDFMKSGKKAKKGELRPPKLKTEDPNKSYVQRPVKRG